MKQYKMYIPINKATRKHLISNMVFESKCPALKDGDYFVVTSEKDGENETYTTVTAEEFKKAKKKGGIIMLGALVKKK